MEYEWDEAKRLSNLKKHGVDFADIEEFGWDVALFESDESKEHGEDRFFALGPFRGKIHVVIFVLRGSMTRLISVRKAEKKEVRRYEKETYQSG